MSRIIAWFVHNSVAANLLMAVLIATGLVSLSTIRQEEFPSIDLEVINISVEYLGATPAEAEASVCIRIEEEIESVVDIDRLNSMAVEGACVVTVEMIVGSDVDGALTEIQNRVDSIDTFPVETERPIISKLIIRHPVMRVNVTGDVDERSLKELAEAAREELVLLPAISQVITEYSRPYEISIEISEEMLRRHGLTLSAVTDAVRRSSLDMPGGSVKTVGGEILLRSINQAYRGHDFEDIVVMTHADGTNLRLREIATIVDGFQDTDLSARHNDKPSVLLSIERVGDEDTLEIAEQVEAWLPSFQRHLPEGVEVSISADTADDLQTRLAKLGSSALGGISLILLILALFLRFRLGMWVAAGVPISLLGAIAVFPVLGVTMSSLTVMGFILVLGILVDDAIVVGESIYSHEMRSGDQIQAAIDGTREVYIPVTFGVLTSVAAFIPLIIIPGRMGSFFGTIGIVAISCLIFSLVESQWILPSHLAHRRTRPKRGEPNRTVSMWLRFQGKLSSGLENLAAVRYRAALERALEWRYTTAAVALGLVLITIALFSSGRMRYQFFPAIEGDLIYASLTMARGAPIEETEAAVEKMRLAAEGLGRKLAEETGGEAFILYTMSSIGKQFAKDSPSSMMGGSPGGSHLGEVYIELNPSEDRELQAYAIADMWRDLIGPIPGAVELTFSAEAFSAGMPINFELGGDDMQQLIGAAELLKERLSSYVGVEDVSDSYRPGKQEITLAVRPEARPLGITQRDLAQQVRQAFYGEEVQRIQRGRDDVKVMVRYSEAERRSLQSLEEMRIRAGDGTELPFAAVANIELGRGFSTIKRADRRRIISVSANVDRSISTPETIIADVERDMPSILRDFPGVHHSMGGEQKDMGEVRRGLLTGFLLTMLMIYALLAIPLKSYSQPFIIMSVIPFGAVGAIFGHLIMGWDIVFFSILGIVALSGVVVNASLVLVHSINRIRGTGVPLEEAVKTAAVIRFRPILLTSVTTFLGLVPLMFEPSVSARVFVPMAVSLAYGVLGASTVTLFLVPSGYLILNDATTRLRREAGDLSAEGHPLLQPTTAGGAVAAQED